MSVRSGWFRPSHDFHGGTRAPEAQVRVVFNVRKQAAQDTRDRIATMPNASASSVIGFGFFESKHLAIQAKDVVFTHMEQTRAGPKTDANSECFSSFNGEVIPSNITQDQFNRQFMAVGVTQGASDPDFKVGGDNSGITVITQGATTITNLSEKEITYGEYVRAVPPSVDKDKRERFHAAMENVVHENFIPGKYTCELQTVTYEDMVGEVAEAVGTLLSDPARFSIPQRATSLQNNVPFDDSDVEGAALNLKRFLSWTLFTAVTLVQQDPGIAAMAPLDLGARLGLIENRSVPEDIPLLKTFIERALLSTLQSTTRREDATQDIVDIIGTVGAAPMSLFGNPSSKPAPSDQLRREGAVAYDLFWRSQAHLLERNSGDILGQAISRTQPGGPLDINLHTS